jgi:hypothetical protein
VREDEVKRWIIWRTFESMGMEYVVVDIVVCPKMTTAGGYNEEILL